MDEHDIIYKALIEYDSAAPVIRYLKHVADYVGNRTGTDTERSTLRFTDKTNGEVILETEIETLAVFYTKLNIWSWAWSQPGLTNAENYKSKEILRYALAMTSDMADIQSILTTSRGVIPDITQIDINLAVASSIIKQPYIYPIAYPIDNDYLIYYFILLNRNKLDELKVRINGKQTSD